MMREIFYEKTGMYVDWGQLEKLPAIDTLIDVGVGPMGTPELYERFPSARLLLIDPLIETKEYIDRNLQHRNVSFHNCAVGAIDGFMNINVEREIGRSTFLDVAEINFEAPVIDKRIVEVRTLDEVVNTERSLGRVGIKIDTEGFELNVIKGAAQTLKGTDFVLAEVRHNHESFHNVYKLHEFMLKMQENGFVLSMILTAKPFIADLCFRPLRLL